MNLRDHDAPCEHLTDWRGPLGESSRRNGHTEGTSKTSVGTWCPGGAAVNIDYEAALGAWHDTPYAICGECLGDGRVVVGTAFTQAGGQIRFMECGDCGALGRVVDETVGIRNAADAALGGGE